MYAGVVSFRVQPGKLEEGVKAYWEAGLPPLREQQGFEGLLFLVDPETDTGYSIGLWRTKEDADAYEGSGAYREAVARFAGLLAEPPERKVYEVGIRA